MHNITLVMKKRGIKLMVLPETHTKCSDQYMINGYTCFHSADEELNEKGDYKQNFTGVTVVVHPTIKDHLEKLTPVNGRLLTVDIRTKGCPISLFAIYAPHEGHEPEVKEEFWNLLDAQCATVPLSRQLIIIGDYNTTFDPKQQPQKHPNIFGIHLKTTPLQKNKPHPQKTQ